MAWVNLLNIVYPVNSVYFSCTNISPSSFIGGTWASITGKYIRTDTNTDTGGSDSVTLTVNNMPSHTHTFTGTATPHRHNFNPVAGGTWEGYYFIGTGPSQEKVLNIRFASNSNGGYYTNATTAAGGNSPYVVTRITEATSITPSGTNSYEGGGQHSLSDLHTKIFTVGKERLKDLIWLG